MLDLPPSTSCLLSGDGIIGLRKLAHLLCIVVCVAGPSSQWSGGGEEGSKGRSEMSSSKQERGLKDGDLH